MPEPGDILVGIDWGGTKMEVVALGDNGRTLLRERAPTPQNDYESCVRQAADLVSAAEAKTGKSAKVGVGIPGTISPLTSLVKNANSTWLNGKPLKMDLESILDREIRIANDANCFAVSEAVDGAAAGLPVVVGMIIGTGCGSGVAINGIALQGANGIAGEFGHTPCPATSESKTDGRTCWCGRKNCFETYLSGPAFVRDFEKQAPGSNNMNVTQILAEGTQNARQLYSLYCQRLALGISNLVNIIDPDAVVLGGGMSNIEGLYKDLPAIVARHAFTDVFKTPILKADHGDSSGVRGAAWLWK